MRICFLCRGFSSNGGIGRVIAILSEELADYLDVYLLSFYSEEAPSYYDVSPKCKQDYLYSMPVNMTKAIIFEHAIKKLSDYIRNYEIDIIIASGALFYPLAVIAAKKAGIKSICWEHTNPNNKNDYKFQDVARVFGAKRSDLNVVLTKSADKVYQTRFPKAKTVQIYNPIDPVMLNNDYIYNTISKRIISVGRLRPQKNFSRLLDIAAVVLRDNPDWEWDIFGDGPLRSELENKNVLLGLEGRVHFRGQVSDLYSRYRDYSFMVMTSDYEGFPMTLLEGAANALPLVAFDVPTGPNEIITDGENGFLCENGNNKQMIDSIETLMSNMELRSRFSETSRKTASLFGVESICKQWKQLLNQMIIE